MTPEEYIKDKFEQFWKLTGESPEELERKQLQFFKDTWNEAVKQAEGVLPNIYDYEFGDDSTAKGFYTCKDQSLQAIDKLKLK